MGILWVLRNTSHMDTAATAESPCSDVTRARVLDPGEWSSGHIHLEQLLVDVGLVEADIHGIPGGHHVVVVDDLKLNVNDKSCRNVWANVIVYLSIIRNQE